MARAAWHIQGKHPHLRSTKTERLRSPKCRRHAIYRLTPSVRALLSRLTCSDFSRTDDRARRKISRRLSHYVSPARDETRAIYEPRSTTQRDGDADDLSGESS